MLKKRGIIIFLIFIITIILLVIYNIHLTDELKAIDTETTEETIEVIKYCPKEEDSKYNEKKTYYNKLNYKTFQKLNKKNVLITVGVVDQTSSTSNKFIELINKQSYHTNQSMYLLDISKLSKKNLVAFYELDDRLKELDYNYIITLKKGKIISITEIDNEEINSLLESYGE